MKTTKEILNPEIFSSTYQKDFPYPKNAYWDIFGAPHESKEINLLPKAEETLEYALGTIDQALRNGDLDWDDLSVPSVAEIFMLRYKKGMTLREIAEHCGNFVGDIEANNNSVQLILAKTLRCLRHPSRSRILKSELEF